MVIPFVCSAPTISFATDGALLFTAWRARVGDSLAPPNRAVYTYATWSTPQQLRQAFGRDAPSAASLVADELGALGDDARWDGTCANFCNLCVFG